MSKLLSDEEFRAKLHKNNPLTKTDDSYRGYRQYMNFYCDKGHSWSALASNALSGYGCPYCSGQRVWVGFNDLWTTHPNIAKLLTNPSDGYTHTKGSEEKLDFTCPDCGYVSRHTIHNVIQHGLSCKRCSDGISFANKFMFSVLEQLQIDFECEYSIGDADYRYDFFLNAYNIIIEMHGRQHYEGWNDKRSLEEIQHTDQEKENYAAKNNINKYIVIDSAVSDMNYISKNIKNSIFGEIFDLSTVNWMECLFYASSSMVRHAADLYNAGCSNTEISQRLHVSMTSVWKWLKTASELNMCDYRPINKFVDSAKQIICVTTNEIFDSIVDASQKYGVAVTNISKVCKHKEHCKHAGKHPITGERLSWMYLDEFNNTKLIKEAI